MNTENRLRIRYLLAGMMMATMLGYGSPATAQPEPDVSIDLPAGIACDFALRVEIFPGGNSHFKEFTDKNGNVVRSLAAGTGTPLRFTNLATSSTFSTKSNGAVSHITFNPDGSRTQKLTGHNVLILFPTDIPPGPSTTLIVGRVVFTIDSNDVATVQDVSGKTTDICAALP